MMGERLIEVFKIISFYDDMRWSHQEENNYYLINFYKDGLDNDTKLLTHWFCYISDRQMPFERIWDIGGYVYSEMVDKIKQSKRYDLLNPNSENAFLGMDIEDKKYYFIGTMKPNKKILDYSGIENDKPVKFKPRFLPSDYTSMLNTFAILKDFDFSLTNYIAKIYTKHKDCEDFVKRVLFALYLLSYYKIGQPKSEDLSDYRKLLKKTLDRKQTVETILNTNFEDEYREFLRDNVFKQKRAWCSLRDFIKSPEFSSYFKSSLREYAIKNQLNDDYFDKLFDSQNLDQLELPGDVWNNNSKFRKCVLSNDFNYKRYNVRSNTSFNKILRKFYDKEKENIVGYPEQFDVTFDFVPRMCESDNCAICPIGMIETSNSFEKVCHKNKEMYCPVVLVGCNYKNDCIGENVCKLCDPFDEKNPH